MEFVEIHVHESLSIAHWVQGFVALGENAINPFHQLSTSLPLYSHPAIAGLSKQLAIR